MQLKIVSESHEGDDDDDDQETKNDEDMQDKSFVL